ncbi:hypothetical protein LCGC14_1834730 [marine sediment metagenome]|uniref:Uncharacterized protein n=1 Tax=marine sediment metagenome TaxID=412755 RepID=A0A0F9GF76_9ZZZZ
MRDWCLIKGIRLYYCWVRFYRLRAFAKRIPEDFAERTPKDFCDAYGTYISYDWYRTVQLSREENRIRLEEGAAIRPFLERQTAKRLKQVFARNGTGVDFPKGDNDGK